MAMPICFKLLRHWLRRALSRADCTAGKIKAIRIPMIAITTSNSTKVKARREDMHRSVRGNELRREGKVVRLGQYALGNMQKARQTWRHQSRFTKRAEKLAWEPPRAAPGRLD